MSSKQNITEWNGEVSSLIDEAFQSADSQSEKMTILADILSAVSNIVTGMAQGKKQGNDTQDAETQALLEAFSKLNSMGRAEAVKHIQNMQYVPGYQKPTE